jgi:hypothetical protein
MRARITGENSYEWHAHCPQLRRPPGAETLATGRSQSGSEITVRMHAVAAEPDTTDSFTVSNTDTGREPSNAVGVSQERREFGGSSEAADVRSTAHWSPDLSTLFVVRTPWMSLLARWRISPTDP